MKKDIVKILKTGLREFLTEDCQIVCPDSDTIAIKFDPPDKNFGVRHGYDLFSIIVHDDHCELFVVPINKGTPIQVNHEYCDPRFPDSVLRNLWEAFDIDRVFDDIKFFAADIAKDAPVEALNEFGHRVKRHPIIGNKVFESDFPRYFKFSCSDDKFMKDKTIEFINSWKLPKIDEILVG